MLNVKPQAVIFDWDGTLVNTIPGIRKAHNHVRTAMGHNPWTEREFQDNLKHSSRELYPRIYGDQAEKAFETLYAYIDAHHLDMLETLDGAEELLRYFYEEQNVPLALVSNKTHDYLVREVDHLGWSDFFYCILGAGQAEKDKPAPDPLIKAIKAAASPVIPQETWFVGDTETDLKASREANCQSVLLLNGVAKNNLITTYKPGECFENCRSFLEKMRDETAKK